jgi:hypothetical protein
MDNHQGPIVDRELPRHTKAFTFTRGTRWRRYWLMTLTLLIRYRRTTWPVSPGRVIPSNSASYSRAPVSLMSAVARASTA